MTQESGVRSQEPGGGSPAPSRSAAEISASPASQHPAPTVDPRFQDPRTIRKVYGYARTIAMVGLTLAKLNSTSGQYEAFPLSNLTGVLMIVSRGATKGYVLNLSAQLTSDFLVFRAGQVLTGKVNTMTAPVDKVIEVNGAEVHVVADAATSKYRMLVVPDSSDTPWPTQLRPGSGVNGWAMLRTVPVWYELWRQINAFPPDLPADAKNPNAKDDAKGGTDAKK